MTRDGDPPKSMSVCPLAQMMNDNIDNDSLIPSGGFDHEASSPFKSKKRPPSATDETSFQLKKLKVELAKCTPSNDDSNCDKENHVPEPEPEHPNLATNQLDMEQNTISNVNGDIETRRKRSMAYLNKFVNISMKYSQFLEQKILTSEPSTSNKEAPPKRQEENITRRLNYFTGELRPYQLEGVTWLTILYENSVNGILADEMGLGKTVQIIALFAHLYERKVVGPFLIVAPLSTLYNWEKEFERFAPKLPVVRLQGDRDEREKQKARIRRMYSLDGRKVKPVVLCTYQIPLMEDNFLQSFHWQYIVVDEGHRIKNADSKLSLELRALKSINRTLLTGTPLQNDIVELWALFNFLMPELFKDREGFSTLIELNDMKDTDKLLENEATTRVIETIHKVLAPFMLRREKKFVLTDIVPKKEVIIHCPMTEVQKYQYLAILHADYNKLMMGTLETGSLEGTKRKRIPTNPKTDYCVERKLEATLNKKLIYNKKVPLDLPDAPYMVYLTMTNMAMMLRKVVNHPYLAWTPVDVNGEKRTLHITEHLIHCSGKLMVLDAMLPKLKAGGHKVLIFSTFVMFLDMVEEMLIMRDHSYRRLDGMTKFEIRNANIDQFSNDEKVFIFLLSTRAGGLGLNLTAADTVIFMDRDWNPMADLQAQDRCHRIGQTKPVMIYSLITKGTIDELILSRGEMKRRLEKVVLQEGKFKTMKKTFSNRDIEELLKLLHEENKSVKDCSSLIYTDEEWEQILDRQDLCLDVV